MLGFGTVEEGETTYGSHATCRAVNMSKARFEGLFVDELALLQPTAGLLKDVDPPST